MEEPAGRLAGVEVKASTSVVDSDFKGLRSGRDGTAARSAHDGGDQGHEVEIRFLRLASIVS
jgi:hypothetical protein